jgi:hypothetical protein
MLSDRVKKWLRGQAERWIEQHYEGPEPPARLGEQVLSFANMFPHATRGEWVTFAADFADQCYRSGYIRGVEWAERDPAAFDSKVPPEMIADQMDPDWRWRPAVVLELPAGDVVPETYEQHEVIRDQVAALNARVRRF